MAKRNMNIKWTNKYSREEGFVKTFHQVEGYFENTFDPAEARKYSATEANKTIKLLNESDEAENNDFAVVPA